MPYVILSFTAVVVLWSLVATRAATWELTAPLAMTAAGAIFGACTPGTIAPALDSPVALLIAEPLLAMLLFVDASEVRGGFFGGQTRSALRLLLIALPLSMVLVVACGALISPRWSVPVFIVVACMVVPSDFSPAGHIVRSSRVSSRVRNILNVESGYNDGMIAPIFVVMLAVASASGSQASIPQVVQRTVTESVKAVLLGLAIGALYGWLVRHASRIGFSSPQAVRIALVALPLMAFFAAVAWQANGFVAAFSCGITYRLARKEQNSEQELALVDDVGTLGNLALWFTFGAVFEVVFGSTLLNWRVVLLSVLVVTVIRIVPVLISFIGSSLPRRDRLLIGVLGPRGAATIVFGLLAYNELDDDAGDFVLSMMAVTVLVSLFVHGLCGMGLMKLIQSRGPRGEGTGEPSDPAGPGAPNEAGVPNEVRTPAEAIAPSLVGDSAGAGNSGRVGAGEPLVEGAAEDGRVR